MFTNREQPIFDAQNVWERKEKNLILSAKISVQGCEDLG